MTIPLEPRQLSVGRAVAIALGAVLVITALAAGLVALVLFTHDPLKTAKSAQEATVQRIYKVRELLSLHWSEHGTLPADLVPLLRPGGDQGPGYSLDRFRPLVIKIGDDGRTIEVTSLGDDGQPGGKGLDADIRGVFHLADSDVRDPDHLTPWSEDPLQLVWPWPRY